MRRLFRIEIEGAVQGLGFLSFVCHLAQELGFPGMVQNASHGVTIEIEADDGQMQTFLSRLQRDKPAFVSIYEIYYSVHPLAGYISFEIRENDEWEAGTAAILPDLAICSDCLSELFDPGNRRYGYPFINCRHCGPRFTIARSIPYKRVNTSMRHYTMCPECEREFGDPADRRFNAQAIACPVCGPRLALWDADGTLLAGDWDAVSNAAWIIREGGILAMKDTGGFRLIADAKNEKTLVRLRERKRRPDKPFVLMYPSIEEAAADCRISSIEKTLLDSPASPIVLLDKKKTASIGQQVGFNNPIAGVMLPHAPLHHLLMKELDFPIVITGGNLSGDSICIEEKDALRRLSGIADYFLVHDLPIMRPMHDSVVRSMAGRELVLRRGRGYAPLPVPVKGRSDAILAMGADNMNTIAISVGKDPVLSQHLGDLGSQDSITAFDRKVDDFCYLHGVLPDEIACDLNPSYHATQLSKRLGNRLIGVQHHYAHVLSCMSDNLLDGQVLGVAWDSSGSGTDGTIWGSEFIIPSVDRFERFAHFKYFMLPGYDKGIREPRRAALGLLFQLYGEEMTEHKELFPLQEFTRQEIHGLAHMMHAEINAPSSCSAGSFFDGIASLIGVRQLSSFEGHAAMDLEFRAEPRVLETYPFGVGEESPHQIIWQPIVRGIIRDMARHESPAIIAGKFHQTMTEIIVEVAKLARIPRVLLTGDCFQNRLLTERTIERLKEEGFSPYWHRRIPPNDGGIALGQIVAAKWTQHPSDYMKSAQKKSLA